MHHPEGLLCSSQCMLPGAQGLKHVKEEITLCYTLGLNIHFFVVLFTQYNQVEIYSCCSKSQ